MLKNILRRADRVSTIILIIALPFILYVVVTELFVTPSAAKIFDTCYRHQQENPVDKQNHAATFAPLLTAMKDGVTIVWHLDAPFGKPEKGPAQLKDVSAEEGNLVLRFDWKDTTFRLKPIDDDEVINVKLQGTWENADGNGCAILQLPMARNWETIMAAPEINSVGSGWTYQGDDVSVAWPVTLYKPST